MLHRLRGGNNPENTTNNGAEHISTKCTANNSPHSAILRLHINYATVLLRFTRRVFFPLPASELSCESYQTVLRMISGIWIFMSPGEEALLLTETRPLFQRMETCQERAKLETCQWRVVMQSIKSSP